MTNGDPIPYRQIGAFAVQFGLIDFMCHQLVSAMIGEARKAAAVTDGMALERIALLVERLVDRDHGSTYLDPLAGDLKALARRVAALAARRNTITHALWLEYEGIARSERVWSLVRRLAENNARPLEPGAQAVDDAVAESADIVDLLISANTRVQLVNAGVAE